MKRLALLLFPFLATFLFLGVTFLVLRARGFAIPRLDEVREAVEHALETSEEETATAVA